MQENSTETLARTLLLQNAHCILLTTLTSLTLQISGRKQDLCNQMPEGLTHTSSKLMDMFSLIQWIHPA